PAVAFSPNGRWLFARVLSGRKLLSQLLQVNTEVSAARPRLLSAYEGGDAIVSSETFSPDSHWLVTRTLVHRQPPTEPEVDVVVELWALNSETSPGRVLFRGEWAARFLMFSLDSHWLVTEGTGGEAQLWDLTATTTDHAARVLRGHHVVSA